MSNENVVELGRLLGDTTRVALLDAMFDGRAYTVTELRRHVGVAASTASEHLSKLLDGGLLAIEPQGRHRYYRLRDAAVADLLETLFEFGTSRPVQRSSKVPADVAFARTCYDHLAGTVAVGLTDQLVSAGAIEFVDMVPAVTQVGAALFESLSLPISPTSQRPTVRRCLDWSERRPHLAGALPAGLLEYMLTERWFITKPSGRALELTETGRTGLHATFGYRVP